MDSVAEVSTKLGFGFEIGYFEWEDRRLPFDFDFDRDCFFTFFEGKSFSKFESSCSIASVSIVRTLFSVSEFVSNDYLLFAKLCFLFDWSLVGLSRESEWNLPVLLIFRIQI